MTRVPLFVCGLRRRNSSGIRKHVTCGIPLDDANEFSFQDSAMTILASSTLGATRSPTPTENLNIALRIESNPPIRHPQCLTTHTMSYRTAGVQLVLQERQGRQALLSRGCSGGRGWVAPGDAGYQRRGTLPSPRTYGTLASQYIIVIGYGCHDHI